MAWGDILEHDVPKRIFAAHVSCGRVAQAYLLVGPDGVGKRRLAMELVKALNCASGAPQACGQCPHCRQISKGTHPDVHVLSPTGASAQIHIDEVRQLLGRIALRPFSANVQAAILDGADRLTEEAANSLLKALEEPSARTRFVLITSHLSDCLPTIVSRCQLVRCHPLPARVVSAILIRERVCEPAVAEAVARLCGGSASLAVELAGRWKAHAEMLERLAAGGASAWMEQPLPEGREDVARLLDGLLVWLRDVTVSAAGDPQRIVHTGHAAAIARQARATDVDRCLETAQELVALRESLEQFANSRLVASLARETWLSLTDTKHV